MCDDGVALAEEEKRDKENRQRQFMQTWEHYAESKRKTHEQLDSYLLKLSAGALVLSLSPTTRLFESHPGTPRYLLALAWLLFTATIAITLLSLKASANAEDEMSDAAFATIVEEKAPEETRQDEVRRRVDRLNQFAIASFLGGLVLGMAYIAIVFFQS